jgi:hypothetical protein
MSEGLVGKGHRLKQLRHIQPPVLEFRHCVEHCGVAHKLLVALMLCQLHDRYHFCLVANKEQLVWGRGGGELKIDFC